MSSIEKTKKNFFYKTISDWSTQKTIQVPHNKQLLIKNNTTEEKNNLINDFHPSTSSPILQSLLNSNSLDETNFGSNYFKIENCKDITKNFHNKTNQINPNINFNNDFLFNNDNFEEFIDEKHLLHSSISTSSGSVSPYSNTDSVAEPSSINSSCGAIVSNGNSSTSFTTNRSELVIQKKSKKNKPVIIFLINN